jgi:hypothetical protein
VRRTLPAVPRPVRLIALCALLALAVAGCGNKQEVRTLGETEGIYIDLGELQYQVQISRQLNPFDEEDRYYVSGLPAGYSQPTNEEEWFGVFIRVSNPLDRTMTPASNFQIRDTQENTYTPVPLSRINVFAYRPTPIGPNGLIPLPDSPSGNGPIQGALLLFKIKQESLQNRPLELRILAPGSSDVGVVDLDV